MSRLDDTSRCPRADRCESCGAVTGLAVATIDTPVGVLCTTLCGPCVEMGDTPPVRSWGVAVERVGEHCIHLGITADQMAAIQDQENR